MKISGILSATACVGVLATAYFASAESAEATEALKKNKPVNVHEHLMTVIPKRKKTILSAGITIGCIAASHTLDMRDLAKVAGSCAAIGGTFSRYKESAKRYFGENKFDDFTKQFEEEEKELHSDVEVMHWFYEPISGKLFEATWQDIYRAIDDAHKIMTLDGGLKFNDFLYFLGLDCKPLSDDIGWDTGDLDCEYGYPWLDVMFDERNNPDKVVDYNFNDGRLTYEFVYYLSPKKMGFITESRLKQLL